MTEPGEEATNSIPSDLVNTKVENVSETNEGSDIAKKVQQRMKLEAHLTSGCGHGKKKAQLLEAFWNTMWKELELIGWRKIEGVGEEVGSTMFFPPKSNGKQALSLVKVKGRRGKDYYDRIKDVIDRVVEGRNDKEKKIADLYASEFIDEELWRIKTTRRSAMSSTTSINSFPEKRSLPKRDRPSLTGNTIDLSWKNGGSLYPKRASQVGDEFQATDIPAAGTYSYGAHSDLYELVWDPNASKCTMVTKLLSEMVPPNKREQALVPLGLMGLDSEDNSPPNMTEILSHLKPVDGSDWTAEEKEKFNLQIFRLRKDISALAKALGKDVKSCYTYYLGTYKKSDQYRLLKTICAEERMEKSSSNEFGVDACAICGDGGSLLICDGCEGEYHMSCLRPKLAAVPEGHWECDECVDRNLLKSRENIIMHTKLYEPYRGNGKKRKSDEVSIDGSEGDYGDIAADGIVLRPSPSVLAAIKTFALQIDAIFSPDEKLEHTEPLPS